MREKTRIQFQESAEFVFLFDLNGRDFVDSKHWSTKKGAVSLAVHSESQKQTGARRCLGA